MGVGFRPLATLLAPELNPTLTDSDWNALSPRIDSGTCAQ